MRIKRLNDIHMHYRIEGPENGPQIVFANSLGTDLRLWDPLLPHLPDGLRILRYDKRGHGLTDCPPAPYTMGQLVRDAEALMQATGFTDAVFVGLSIGGMIAQGLAAKRLDLVRALVLSNTGAKIGTREIWDARVKDVQTGGIESLADAVMQRWFSPSFRESPQMMGWRNMLTRTPDAGYAGCSAAISGSDFFATTAALRLPTLGIAGTEDGSTPPDLVRETVDLIPGSRFHLIRGAGHLPCVENPKAYAAALTGFLRDIGHIP